MSASLDSPGSHSNHRPPRRRRWLELGVVLLLALCAGAALAPRIAPAGPLRQDLSQSLASPSAAHPLGTDRLGRDVLARLLFGARLSLGVGAAAVAASLFLGTALGALAGYGGRWIDEAVLRASDVVLAFPGILLAVALAAVLGPSARNVVVALTVMGWPAYARLVRAELRAAATLDYARAAESLGASAPRIAVRHLLPAAWPSLAVQASFGMSGAIIAEAGLSFLGLGVPPPAPSWGAMLAEGRSLLVVAPRLTIAPAVAVLLTVLAINLIAEDLSSGTRRSGATQR